MISYRIDVADVHAHLFRITLTLPRPEAEQRLSLPVWIPGSYLVREFARHLSALSARQGGRDVPLRQLDKATWLARCDGRGTLVLSYLVYAFDSSVRTAYLDAGRGFFNGTAVFLRVHGREDEAHALAIGPLPAGWEIATAMPPGTQRRSYRASDYHALVDHPVELGRFWCGRFSAAGVTHEFVVAGALPGFDGERLLADAKRICETEIAFWHGPGAGAKELPFQRRQQESAILQGQLAGAVHGPSAGGAGTSAGGLERRSPRAARGGPAAGQSIRRRSPRHGRRPDRRGGRSRTAGRRGAGRRRAVHRLVRQSADPRMESGDFKPPGRVGLRPPGRFRRRRRCSWARCCSGPRRLAGSARRVRPGGSAGADSEPFRPLLAHLLGDTWFVDRLGDALALSRSVGRGLRFVTPKGEVLEADGTLVVGPPRPPWV